MTKQGFDASDINEKSLAKFQGDYSDNGFMDKLTRYGKSVGIGLLYQAVQLWFVMQRPDVPATTKAVIMGALGYLIAPLDFLPDFTPAIGYCDDAVAIIFAFVRIQGYIDDDIKAKSKNLLTRVFDAKTVADLD